ncbi:MAG: phosphomethylpyrimidine synthase ThiC [Planctomycetota bacterium]|jgi:phosphomethylpyrimidine synthase
MSLIEKCRQGEVSGELRSVAAAENVSGEYLRDRIADGTACMPWSKGHQLEKPCAIGQGLKIKVNANLGTSMDKCCIETELEKLKAALDAGADAVMDLSTGGNLREVRAAIRENSPVTLGSVPIYEVISNAVQGGCGSPKDITGDQMLDAVRLHAEDGIDFVTVHCGLTQRCVEHLRNNRRIAGVVSRGGSTLAKWMVNNEQENPYYERFDELLAICKEHEVTISLGDGLRPGALADAGDRAQMEELYNLGELVLRAREAGVQVMVEGPGHVPLQDVEAQIRMQKVSCHDAPFYVLGPLVTDVAPGYDHIAGAIGGALAAKAGADFLCFLTPAEHLRLPDAKDTREGVIASRIAAHAADIARGFPHARDWDDAMSKARKARDWEGQLALCMDPETARSKRAEAMPEDSSVCSMCSELCALKGEDGL